MPTQPGKFMPALYGGIIMAVISAVPVVNFVNCFCCAGIMLGGFLAVFFYKKELTPESPPLTSGDALQLGALAGVVGAIIGTLLSAGIFAALGNVTGELIGRSMERFREEIPPEAFDQMVEGLRQGGFTMFHLFSSLIIDPLFGLVGGLIGYSVFKSKPGMMPVQPPSTPPATMT